MKKYKLFLILALVSFVLSLAVFHTLKEDKVSYCRNIECGNYLRYSDAFTKNIFTQKCPLICDSDKLEAFEEGGDPTTINYTVHNPIYIVFVYLSILFLILSLIFYLKSKKVEK